MTKIVGHRGSALLWPENSLHGFRNTQQLDVDAVELDIHLSDAGELVVIHDALLDRTTDGTGPVRALTPQTRLDVTLKGTDECPPLLEEVLDLFQRAERPVELHLELKNDETGSPYPGLPAKTIATVHRMGMAERCHLTSFTPAVLETCKELAPDIPRLMSINGRSAQFLGLERTLLLASGLADIVAVHKQLLEDEFDLIARLIPLKRLCVWVVNTAEELETWLPVETGHLTTDDAQLALDIRNRTAATALTA